MRILLHGIGDVRVLPIGSEGRAQRLLIPQRKLQRFAGENVIKRVLTKHLHREPAQHAQLPGGRIKPRVQGEIAILIQTLRGSGGRWCDLNVERKQSLRAVRAWPKPENERLQVHREIVAVHGGVRNGNFHENR